MEFSMEWAEQLKQIEAISGDRRQDRRYEIQLETRWKLIRRRRILDTGTGRTVDLSSGGIAFEPGRLLPVGLNVELAISWPVLLHNVAPMQLVVSGRIVRSDERRAAIHMVQHEFRTMGMSAEQRSAINPAAARSANGPMPRTAMSPVPSFAGLR
jgi:hypothetical protein